MNEREFEAGETGPSRDVVSRERQKGALVFWHLTLSCGHVAVMNSLKSHTRKSLRCALCPSSLSVSDNDRNRAMLLARNAGATLAELGKMYGVSTARAQQICSRLARA